MATEKWINGATSGWAVACSSTGLNGLSSNNAILSDTVISNSALDVFADVSISLSSAAFVSPNYIGVYIYPLNSDGSTYGDSRFTSCAAGPPPSNYVVGSIGLVAATQTQTGTLSRVVLPPGQFKFVFYNQGGVTLGSSGGNTVSYRTYNRAIS